MLYRLCTPKRHTYVCSQLKKYILCGLTENIKSDTWYYDQIEIKSKSFINKSKSINKDFILPLPGVASSG